MNSSQTLDLVRVAVPVPLRRHFDYLSPLPLPAPGCRVEIPFGPQTLVGLVVDHPTESQVPRNKLKPLKRVLDSAPVLGPDILALMAWSAGYYQHPLGEVLPHALPVLVRKGEPAAYRELEFWFATDAGMAIDLNELKRAAKRHGRSSARRGCCGRRRARQARDADGRSRSRGSTRAARW